MLGVGMTYIGRLAPSPTGAQHLGNARTFFVAWLACRQAKGKLLLRIEDLDSPRTKSWAIQQAMDDLRWLGLDWDATSPDMTYVVQTAREPRYRQVLHQLMLRELVYPCTCSRSQIEESASAPHESQLDGMVYPGTCSHRSAWDHRELDATARVYSWRFRMPDGIRSIVDEKMGQQTIDAKKHLGDFIVARNSGSTAYQLAVVIDDHDFAINHVVRGNDLIYSTFRQEAIYLAMGWQPPHWLHLPLVVGTDGRRLAKRHGDTRLSHFREQGITAVHVLSYLVQSLGLPCPRNATAQDVLKWIGDDSTWIHRTPNAPIVFNGNL